MSTLKPITLTPTDANWPGCLTERLGKAAPSMLQVIGPVAFLAGRKTALFCSARTPGDAILRVHDTAQRLRDEGITIISGFHSPIEKECLRILLRGKQPIILCPARAVAGMRMPTECQTALEEGQLLFLSPFIESPKRVTKDSARHRNEVVAALADEVFIAHITAGGETARVAGMLKQWRVPFVSAMKRNGCGE